jgi:hypothetical protein
MEGRICMSRALKSPPSAGHQRINEERRIRQHVRLILQAFHRTSRVICDRRRDHRVPFPYPIHVTPFDTAGCLATSETFVVLGKHLSERGLDFYCQMPIPHRRVIVSWECGAGRWIALLLDLTWCRSNHHGWYENGGRFLQVVESPLGNEQTIDEQRSAPAGCCA